MTKRRTESAQSSSGQQLLDALRRHVQPPGRRERGEQSFDFHLNIEFMPELHREFGYGWALGLMLSIATLLTVVFRRMDWL